MAFIRKQHDGAAAQEQDIGTLLGQLDSLDPSLRRAAARALRDAPASTRALAALLARESDAAVRAALVDSLAHLGGEVAADALLWCLRSEDPALRSDAIEALKTMPADVAPLMEGLLADTDADVRIFAVNILEALRHPQVEAWLIQVIEQDAHVNVCACAVDLLAEVGTPAALPALDALRSRFADEPFLDFAIGLACARCAAESA